LSDGSQRIAQIILVGNGQNHGPLDSVRRRQAEHGHLRRGLSGGLQPLHEPAVPCVALGWLEGNLRLGLGCDSAGEQRAAARLPGEAWSLRWT